ncbi:MAG: hypothetical protein J1F23_06225 [Oscillospiraceae bacterium]|nr:hypothetical protein [Oscillospiraceae bacterium]
MNSVLTKIRDSSIIKNPVLFEAVGICPIVAIATSLKLAVYLTLVTAVELILCEVIASLLLKNVRRYWRVALYVILGIAIILPITYFTVRFFPGVSMNLGVFLPLLAVNSIVALHCERVAVKSSVGDSFTDAVASSLGYGAVTLVVGFFRELLGGGTLWGMELRLPLKFSALLLPFGGLIIIGFSAAVLKAIIGARYPDASPDSSFDTSEIRRSLRGSFRDLMGDEFNPYDDTADTETENYGKKYKKQKKASQKMLKNKKAAAASMQRNAEHDFRTERETENTDRTYLDDFSDILSELDRLSEEYGNNINEEDPHTDSENGGGDGE